MAKRPAQILVNLLKEKKLRIAFAESVSCGYISHKMGTISGTSDVLAGSIICYCEEVKINLLKIKRQLITKYKAESQPVTDALAKNLSKIISADIHAAVTGLAAPGGSESKQKPEGTVFFSVYVRKKLYKMKKVFNGSPLSIKEKTCKESFRFITKLVKSMSS